MSTTPHLVASRPQRSSRVAATVPRVLGDRSAGLSIALALVGVAAAVTVVATRSPALALTAYRLAGGAALVALPLGVWLHRPRTAAPWVLLSVALVGFAGGAALREAARAADVGTTAVPVGVHDVFSYAGYAMLIAAIGLMLRATGTRRDRGATADGIMITAGSALLSWAYLIDPVLGTAATQGEVGIHVLMASYPVLDTVLLYLMIRVGLAQRDRGPALLLGLLAFTCLLWGDTAYVIVHAGIEVGIDVPPPLVDALHLLAFTNLAAAALHPTMQALTAPQPLKPATLRRSRLAVVAISMLIPAVLTVVRPPADTDGRLIMAVAMAAITVAVLRRTSTAVNEHARDAEVLGRAAAHDGLTGLPNRTSLLRHTGQALARVDGVVGVAVICVGLDGFKLVNNSWGRAAGDELLLSVGSRLRAVVGPDVLVARSGGDEFVIVCEGPGVTARAGALAHRMLDTIAEPFSLQAGRAHLTASLGWAHHGGPDGPATADSLLRDAEAALHRAKDQGRNRAIAFDRWMFEHSSDRIALQLALRDAVADGGITVAYQPLVDVGTGLIQGFEALARWDRPDVGPVPPTEFIPIAEETGLIVPLGADVLSTAMGRLAGWRAERELAGAGSLHLSVNVAARQLSDPGFAGLVASLLAEHDLPGSALWLEITESVLVADEEATLLTLQRLDALGVALALDDFGTGYSSLGYLTRFPVGALKVDRSFVAELGEGSDRDAIVGAVVAMAHALDLEVVAEGVETEAQRDLVQALGCRLAQGWLYGRAVEASVVTELLRTGLPLGTGVAPLRP